MKPPDNKDKDRARIVILRREEGKVIPLFVMTKLIKKRPAIMTDIEEIIEEDTANGG